MDNRPIGVFDSGLGGLTVVKELMETMPRESIVYFGDTGRVPYGSRSRETIQAYAMQDIRFLLTFDIKAVIIACGTASAVALEHVRKHCPVPILGVVEPTAQAAAQATQNKKIGILGTNGTIQSGSYQKYLASLDNTLEIYTQACPMFVPLVENGYANHKAAYVIAEEYLAPLKAAEVDTIILGCTHYPLLKQVISDIMGAGVTLIESGVPTARRVQSLLEEQKGLSDTDAAYSYYVSDSADGFVRLGELFLNREIHGHIKQIAIESY